MKHLKGINESIGDGSQDFECDFDGIDFNVSNEPKEWSDRELNITENGKLKWNLSMNYNKRGVEWFGVSVSQLVFLGSFENDEEIEFEIQDSIDTDLYDITKSFYPTYIDVDMKNNKDPADWSVKVYFGNPTK